MISWFVKQIQIRNVVVSISVFMRKCLLCTYSISVLVLSKLSLGHFFTTLFFFGKLSLPTLTATIAGDTYEDQEKRSRDACENDQRLRSEIVRHERLEILVDQS